MGWLHDKAPGHEGWLVALVKDEEIGLARNDYYRELELHDHRSISSAAVARMGMQMQVGCDCGWRSPRMPAPPGAEWHPFILCVDDATEERCRLLWHGHLSQSASLRACESCGAPADHAEHFGSRIRSWCEQHTPWSGHFEFCGASCKKLLETPP